MLTEEEYDVRLGELQKIRIELDTDPLSSGLAGINKKIAELQGQKDRVNALFIEAITNRTQAEILSSSKENEYDRGLDRLLSSDIDVMNQKSEKLRVSTANTKMPELVLQVHYSKKDYEQADAYYKCVSQVYSNLESANVNLSRQISVIQMSLQVGEISKNEVAELWQGRTMKVK
jgi:hypothetical protein